MGNHRGAGLAASGGSLGHGFCRAHWQNARSSTSSGDFMRAASSDASEVIDYMRYGIYVGRKIE